MIPNIALIIHGLRLHSEDKETQLHGIQALGNLMPPADLTDTVVSIVCIGLEDWPEEAEIQEAGFLALCHIILHCPFEILVDMAITETGFMTTTVKGMTSFPSTATKHTRTLTVPLLRYPLYQFFGHCHCCWPVRLHVQHARLPPWTLP